jgi:hypothetical protein
VEVHLGAQQEFASVAHLKDGKIEQLMVLQALLDWAPLVALLHWWLQKEHYCLPVEWRHQHLVLAEDQEWKVDYCLQ